MEKRRGVTQQTPRHEHRFARSTLPFKLRLGEGEAPGLHSPGEAGRVEKRAFSEFFGEGLPAESTAQGSTQELPLAERTLPEPAIYNPHGWETDNDALYMKHPLLRPFTIRSPLFHRADPLEPLMFEIQDGPIGRGIRRIAAGLAVLSLTSLLLTSKILLDVHHEHEIMARLVLHLPPSDAAAAEGLLGELRLDRMLTILLVVNLSGTTIALALVVRGYLSSERSLRAVKVLATDILASMDAGVITTDRNGMISSTNPRAQTLIGSPDNEGVGHYLSDLGDEHALLDSICSEVRTYHDAIRDRDYCVTSNGHRQTLRAGCTLLSNQQGEDIGTVLHVRDVTEKALIEERLRRMERYMGLGSLAAGLQHEIKNPLSAVSIHIQLLCEHLASEPYDPEVAELLDVLQTEVHRINNVLDGFRNYASMSEIGRSAVDVTLLIDKLVRLLRPQADQQQVKIKIESPPEMLGLIQADSVRLEQVFLNLALNAMAAMPDGGLLRFRVGQLNDQIRIDIADTGNGILPEIQSQIFDPYFTTRSEGTGMGLALCDKIIRQHDGSIDFRTSPDGTEFTVLLPRGTQE